MSKHTVTDLYARLLAQEMTFYVAKREGMIGRITQEVETPPAWQELDAENDQVFQQLKGEGKFFHKGGGSVFMDYKNLRDSVASEEAMLKISTRLSSGMSKDDLLNEVKKVIEQWQATSGTERKR